PIGRGGMGEVYRAHDPRMGREVAIKISAERFSERFDREVRAIAALNHPNVCTLYDVGPNYLVMELVEGPTLAERIAQGRIPLEEALGIARQIAAGLEAAHERGITHRDLKPGNVKIKPDGTVKVLDFGLAKVSRAEVSGAEDSPTLTMHATQAGVILGTAVYMAPEQARGKPVDKRADIWAFGVVLYEMVTARRLFAGEDLTDTLAAVVKIEPDLSAAPPEWQRLLKRCLEKDPRKRLRDIGDVWDLLDQPRSTGFQPVSAEAKRSGPVWWLAAAAILALALAALAFVHFRETPPTPELVRFEIPAPGMTGIPMVSPDGKLVAYIAPGAGGRSQLWVHSLETNESRALPGTGDASSPFWSPDSRFLGFEDEAERKLRKVAIAGGPPQVVTDVEEPVQGGTWMRDENGQGIILFGNRALGSKSRAGIRRVSESGGTASPVTQLAEGEVGHAGPQFLPDGRHFLYTRLKPGNDRAIHIGSLDDPPDRQSSEVLVQSETGAWYAPMPNAKTGHLLFTREGTLVAQPFDPGSLKLSGEAAPLAEGFPVNTARPFFASTNGVLTYRAGTRGGNLTRLTWFDRSGKNLGTIWEPGAFNTLALSPDGTRVAVDRRDLRKAGSDLFVYEFDRSVSTQLTFTPGAEGIPLWSHDGNQIIFTSVQIASGEGYLYRKASSGAGADELLLKSAEPKLTEDLSRDGRFLLYSTVGSTSDLDIWKLPLDGSGKEEPYIKTDAFESQARFSPGGDYVVYTLTLNAGPTSQSEVYVQPFPDPSKGKWKVSEGGGSQPVWSFDGKEIFYISADSKMMAVEVSTTPVFKLGGRKELFAAPVLGGGRVINVHRYDVTADGKRFLINSLAPADPAAAEAPSPPITVILNWQELLRR
ncbi:MAG TPA: protein kinase, partial [Methylomirabilota bacterium]|nr:protein kinase [Methylomirabilota bacterium]